MDKINFAVNGTLMRGFKLNKNLLELSAEFVSESRTSPRYRIWTVQDEYPAMLRDEKEGEKIVVELWKLSPDALDSNLLQEPPGLCLGKIELDDGDDVLGVLGESYVIQGQKEITEFGGWRQYVSVNQD
ncbi:MAG: glutamyl-tRNA amidotransferase [Chloroflexi bacterium HGW-Chloroflexi-3]|nr:MAG: glutamyl-tRNA amidotransferase [Chloroflexi bacterium HGW-Chloroflexi-3]